MGLLEDIAARLERIELALTDRAPERDVYEVRKGKPLPGFSDRRSIEIARQVPGARKAGRSWLVPRAGLDTWLAERQPRKSGGRVVRGPWSPQGALAAANTRGGAR
jgi:hypothetical protein